MKARRIRAVARKEFLHIWRDPRSLTGALALPAMMLLLFGWALTLDVDRLRTWVVDLDRTPSSRQVVSLFEGSRYFVVAGVSRDESAMERRLLSGDCLVGVVIPHDFQGDLSAGRQTQIQILLDGSDSNTASIGLGYAEALFGDAVWKDYLAKTVPPRAGAAARPRLQVDARVWYNPRLLSKNYIVPGLLAVILSIISALLTSLTIAREREMGTLEQLLATPVRPAELVLGKLSAYLVLGAVDAVLAVVMGVAVFGVPLRGSLLLLAAGCGLFLIGSLSWGILLSSVSTSQLMAYQAAMVTTFLPAFLLSGFVFAIDNMPVPVQIPTHVIPARYFITILRGIFLKGVGLDVLGTEFALLSLLCLVVFAAAVGSLKRKEE